MPTTLQPRQLSFVPPVLTGLTVRPPTILYASTSGEPLHGEHLFADGTSSVRVTYEASPFSKMFVYMLGLAKYFKIFWSVVQAVTVDMVNYFVRVWKQFSTKVLLHNIAMFKSTFTVDINNLIATSNGPRSIFSLGAMRGALSSPYSVMVCAITTFAPLRVVRVFRAIFNFAFFKFNRMRHTIIIPERK